MKTSLAWIGTLLLVGLATSYAAADYPPCPPQPACNPGCGPMPSPSGCYDPCTNLDPCKPSWNPFKNWFHHEPKVKEVKVKEPKTKGPEGINSPVFPVHPYARSPRDFFMLD